MRHGLICKRRCGGNAFSVSDLSTTKKRPALVVATLTGDDIILCQITSQIRGDQYGVPLNDADFIAGSLRHPSIIRPNRLFTVESGIVLYRAGTVSRPKLQEVIDRIMTILQP